MVPLRTHLKLSPQRSLLFKERHGFILVFNSLHAVLLFTKSIPMVNSTDAPLYGWKDGSNERGTMDIIWSCAVTVGLCCWVSVYPNVGASTDKWYHPLIDKLNLFFIAVLGPDFLFGIAFGQWSKARQTVKLFKDHPPSESARKWTYKDAFFVNSGGVHLTSPDFPEGFPIDAQQVHYLIKHGFIEPLNLEALEISERNAVDTLSRVITLFQIFWFSAGLIQRASKGLQLTTLELTTASFAVIMFATSAVWHHKPCINKPQSISTKDLKTVQEIRDFSQSTTHPVLPSRWYRTPVEYISQEHFGINLHWSYYTRLAYILRIRIFTRPVTSRPWDRVPSDTWYCPSLVWTTPALFVAVLFSILLITGWNFHFPTPTERILWRVFSVYHAVFSLYGTTYYFIEMLKSKKRPSHSTHSRQHLRDLSEEVKPSDSKLSSLKKLPLIKQFLQRWSDTQANNDPEDKIPLRVLIPITITCFLYVLCRLYIYVEDFISLREQPAAVYASTDVISWIFGS